MRLFRTALTAAAITLAVAVAPAAHAAPPGWELRNGTWVPLVQPGTGTPEAQVAQMIQQLQAGNAAAVIRDATDWVKRNRTNPLMPQVLLLQGDAEVLRGNKYRALYPYEDLLNNYPSSDLYLAVLEREFHLADAFLNGYKRKFLGLRVLPVTDDALQLLDRIQDRQRGSSLAERAGLRVADYYYAAGKFPEAIDAYSDFLKRYPYSQYVRKAEIRRAEASLGNFRGLLFDFTPLYDARERIATITEAFPQTAEQLQARAIDDRIYQLEGEKELEIARYYYRAGKRHASAYYYRRVIEYWPDTSFADSARRELLTKIPGEASR
jgi:outer membrane protein assembly factor BamD (BamD/ComL family)